MRSRARAMWVVVSLAFRADRAAASFAAVLGVAQGLLLMAEAMFLAQAVQAAVARDGHDAAVAVVSIAVTEVLMYGTGMLVLDLRFRLTELVAELVDGELIERMTSVTTLELHERPVHYDRIEILRKQIGMLSNCVGALIHNLSVWTGLLSTVGLLMTVHPVLALLPLAGVPAIMASARGQRSWDAAIDRSSERLRRANHLYELATTPSPAKELRTFGIAGEVVRRHRSLLRSVYDEISGTQLRWGALAGVGWAVFGLGELGAIVFVAWQAANGAASVGDVVLTVTVTATLQQHLEGVYAMVAWLLQNLRAAERYVEVIDAADALEVPPAQEPAPAPARLQQGIELDGVTFRYPDAGEDVLHDVSLLVPAGATVAIVGENGAGKSTLVKLLARMYEPTAGAIRVDGTDLARIDVGEWRSRLSGAFQDHARFELVAREVVGVGDLGLIDDGAAVAGALARAGGGELPDRFDRGLDTPLGRSFEDGTEPSGGQWQQLALGRALLRARPLLLLLDEPTSALDPDAEHTLFEGYAAAARDAAAETGAITVLVSHRFSTVRMADLIVVMEGGRVAQHGTHEQLLAAGGTYADLYTMQARAYR